jgi:glycosyltransferase AglD
MISLAIPVHNEEKTLADKLGELEDALKDKPYWPEVMIILANNGSTDSTGAMCDSFVRKGAGMCHDYHAKPGKGGAIKSAWQSHKADQYWFTDLDLAVSPEYFDQMHSILSRDEADIVIGSRYMPASKAERTLARKIASKGYNALLSLLFDKSFCDAQCGFKGVNDKAVQELLPKVKSEGFFFDTELLIRADKDGYRVREIPVKWKEGEHSKVRLCRDVPYFLKEMIRLYKDLS